MRYIAERSGNKPGSPDFYDAWPEYYPPYTSGLHVIVPTPEGNIVIRRARTAKSPEAHYDLVNRRGGLEARYALQGNQEIVSFGKNTVYVVTTDEDGLRWLARHPWP